MLCYARLSRACESWASPAGISYVTLVLNVSVLILLWILLLREVYFFYLNHEFDVDYCIGTGEEPKISLYLLNWNSLWWSKYSRAPFPFTGFVHEVMQMTISQSWFVGTKGSRAQDQFFRSSDCVNIVDALKPVSRQCQDAWLSKRSSNGTGSTSSPNSAKLYLY